MRARIWVATFPVALVLLAASAPRAAIGAVGSPAVTCASSWSAADEPPNPAGLSGPDILNGVTLLSSTNAWAVGSYFNGMADRTLIVHWNGSVWKVVASPNVGGVSRENFLTSVVAISAQNIWAVGSHNNGTADRTLIMHWNGSSWKIAASSNRGGPASENILTGVAAASASEIWAVGKYDDGAAFQTLIERWNGTSWANVASPDPGGPANNNVLNGVTAASTSNVWAVGYYFKQGGAYRTLTVHWTGTAWSSHLREQHLGRRRYLRRHGRPNADRASDGLQLGRRSQPKSCQRASGHRRPHRGGRHVRKQCVGGRHLLPRHRRPDIDRALGRRQLEGRAKPKPRWPRR